MSFSNCMVKETVNRRCSVKTVFLKILQNSQENTCARVSFLIKLQALDSNLRESKEALLFQKFKHRKFINTESLINYRFDILFTEKTLYMQIISDIKNIEWHLQQSIIQFQRIKALKVTNEDNINMCHPLTTPLGKHSAINSFQPNVPFPYPPKTDILSIYLVHSLTALLFAMNR